VVIHNPYILCMALLQRGFLIYHCVFTNFIFD
jgi:hypothetical protein